MLLGREVVIITPYLGRLNCMFSNGSIQLNKLSFDSADALKYLRSTYKSDEPKHRNFHIQKGENKVMKPKQPLYSVETGMANKSCFLN